VASNPIALRLGSADFAAMTRPEWRISDGLVPYDEALATMEARVAEIRAGQARELVWLLEHPPIYTAGTSAKAADLLQPLRFPVHVAGRGGQYTYHGPGQRVVYAMLDLRTRRQDVRRFVFDLEEWTIRTLARFNVTAERRPGRVGVWVARPDKSKLPDGSGREDKIAAIGVRIRHWVSFHGLSINLEPDLSHYEGIVPCGIAQHGVTSLVDLGRPMTMAELDMALAETFDEVFEAVRPSAAA
jgi:lipoyl(octanoyl) transferase